MSYSIFFTMPALHAVVNARNKQKPLGNLNPEMVLFFHKIESLWNYLRQKNYSAINSHSIHDTPEELIANITNEESVAKLKELGAYNALYETIFDYYNSIKIRVSL